MKTLNYPPVLAAVCASLLFPLHAGAEITQQAFLKGSNTGLGRNFGPGDQFGGAVALSGDTMVVGATFEASKATGVNPGPEAEKDNSAVITGAAYVFRRNDAQWKQEAYLKASDAFTAQRFGTAVAISGDTIAVGASGGLGPFGGRPEGAAYVFVRNGETWTEQAKLPLSVPYSGGLSIDGDTLAIGHSWFNQGTVTRENEAHVYVRANGVWTQQTVIKASQNSSISLAVSGDNLVVGGRDGTAFFRRTGSTWSPNSSFPEIAQPGLRVSGKVAIAVVGPSPTAFELIEETWTNKGAIDMSKAESMADAPGLALEGDRLVVGSACFLREGTAWKWVTNLKGANVEDGDYFGAAVGLSNDTVIVGAPREDSTATSGPEANDGSDEGAVYVFTGFEAPKPPPTITTLPEITVDLPSKPWVFGGPDPPVFRLVELGSHLPGERVEQVITLTNKNEVELTGLSVQLKPGFLALPESIALSGLSVTTIPPGGSATFKITFSPKASIRIFSVLGVFTGEASVNSFADIILQGSSAAPRQVDDRQMFQLTDNRLLGFGGASILGYAWGDLNGDDRLDVLVFGWQSHAFLNLPDGSFQRLSTNFGAVPDGYLADFDRDGDLDVFAVLFPEGLAYFENKGDLVFERKPGNLPNHVDLPLPRGGHLATTLLDDNGDGLLDVMITDGGGFQGAVPVLLRNQGNGQFQYEAEHAMTKAGKTHQRTAWIDINNNGTNDILALSIEGNAIQGKWQGLMFDGLGQSQFSLQGEALNFSGRADLFGALGAWGDYDNDGDFDFIRADSSTHLLRNNSGVLSQVEGHPFGPGINPFWGDYDNDGLLDLALTTRASYDSTAEQVQFYHNGGEGAFTKVDYESVPLDPGLDTPGVGVFGDEDNDGDLDFRLSRGADRSATDPKDVTLRNKGNANGWLKVRLQGVKSNPHGIGAKVRVKATIRGQEVWQLRGIFSGGPTGLMPEAHFGLGDAATVDVVKIEWPSGISQELIDVSPRQLLKIREAQRAAPEPPPTLGNIGYAEGSFRFSLPSKAGAKYDLEYSVDLKEWTIIQPDFAGNGVPESFTETDGQRQQRSTGFYRVRMK